MNTKTIAAVTAALALVGAACSGDDDTTADTTEVTTIESTAAPSTTDESTTTTLEEATTTTVAETVTTTTVPDVLRMPLNGEPIDDADEIPDRPALVVKLSNAGGGALPQAGLNAADIVIEEVINDNTSRLAAVFHSEGIDPVGPVRSGRAQDINVMLAFDRPLFAWSGGNPAVTRAIRDSDLINLDARFSPGYYRRSGRSSPNNLFSSTDALWNQTTDETGRPSQVFSYVRPGDEIDGDDATEITLRFDALTVEWTYDEETDGYYRVQSGQEHNTETEDGIEQVWTKNLVVMLADYGVNPLDGNPDAQVLGSNPVYVFSNGTVQEGVWLRFEPTDPFAFFTSIEDLTELRLQPGRTWLEIPRNREGTVVFE